MYLDPKGFHLRDTGTKAKKPHLDMKHTSRTESHSTQISSHLTMLTKQQQLHNPPRAIFRWWKILQVQLQEFHVLTVKSASLHTNLQPYRSSGGHRWTHIISIIDILLLAAKYNHYFPLYQQDSFKKVWIRPLYTGNETHSLLISLTWNYAFCPR